MLQRLSVALAFALLAMAFAPLNARAADEPTLKVGDPAPKLYVSNWLNGKAVDKFEKDNVYVVECWATWCGPCIQAIPHVSKMNDKFKDKKVTFIGLNVFEEDQSKVDPFVKKMGDKLNYVVAIDDGAGDEGKSAKAWLAAAGQNGIPCSFVVDKQGKIAWIGHPMAGLDKVVAAVVDGTFDPKKEAEKAKKISSIEGKIQEAAQAREWDRVIKLFDQVKALKPESAAELSFYQFAINVMEKKDYDAGYTLAKKLLEGDLKDDAQGLNRIAWFILDEEKLEKRDFDVALAMAKRAAELTKLEDAPILDTLAFAHFEKKEVDKAIEYATKAVEKAGNDEEKDQMKAALDRYKKAKQQ